MTLLEILKFEDWISIREFEDNAWIVVARSIKTGDTDLFTISVLAKAVSEDKYTCFPTKISLLHYWRK